MNSWKWSSLSNFLAKLNPRNAWDRIKATKPMMHQTMKIVLTGRLRVGKDFCARAVGAEIIGFADPLYAVAKNLLGYGPEDKDKVPGLREFYQRIGNWGRGEIEEGLSVERALFSHWARYDGPGVAPYVDWSLYGQPNSGIWVKALLERARSIRAPLLFVTNCRFQDEFKTLTEAGFDHWHVMTSRQTYEERLKEVGLTLNSKELQHSSEKLAADLDLSVANLTRSQPNGPKLKVIWSDTRQSPSGRLATLDEFKTYLQKQNEQQPKPTTTSAPEPAASVSNDAKAVPAANTVPEQDNFAWLRRGKGKSAT